MNNKLEIYKKLNTSYDKKLLFRFNSGQGFYSEYNNMLLAVLYCLHNKIQFHINSVPGMFDYKLGWEDYFEPFCPENNELSQYNQRLPMDEKYSLCIKQLKNLFGYDYLTSDMWTKMRCIEFMSSTFCVPELDLKGNLYEALYTLNQIIYVPNTFASKYIQKRIKKLKLPTVYAAMQVRGGDKITEDKLYSPDAYMHALTQKNPNIKDVFVLTDDYALFAHLKSVYDNYNFYTLCEKQEKGYVLNKIASLDKKQIYFKHLDLMTSVDVMKNADVCIGTRSSNPGLYLTFVRARQGKEFINVDTHNNQAIWY